MNSVQLIGYLGKDPVIKQRQNGLNLAILRLATDRYAMASEGKKRKFTEWHTVMVWGQDQVEKLRNYLIKGSHIMVGGAIRYSTFSDNSGRVRDIVTIHASFLVDLDR